MWFDDGSWAAPHPVEFNGPHCPDHPEVPGIYFADREEGQYVFQCGMRTPRRGEPCMWEALTVAEATVIL